MNEDDVLKRALNIAAETDLEEAEKYMNEKGILTNGVIPVSFHPLGDYLRYIGRGGSYIRTIASENDEKFIITSWAGWIEEKEKQLFEEESKTRCPNCGRHTKVRKGVPRINWSCNYCDYTFS